MDQSHSQTGILRTNHICSIEYCALVAPLAYHFVSSIPGSVNERPVRRRHLRHGLLEVVSTNAEVGHPSCYMSLVSFS